jgi:hypothetical protein
VVHLIIVLAVVGFLLYLVNRFVPMDAKIKTIINWVVVACIILWLLNVFGILQMANAPVPHLHG